MYLRVMQQEISTWDSQRVFHRSSFVHDDRRLEPRLPDLNFCIRTGSSARFKLSWISSTEFPGNGNRATSPSPRREESIFLRKRRTVHGFRYETLIIIIVCSWSLGSFSDKIIVQSERFACSTRHAHRRDGVISRMFRRIVSKSSDTFDYVPLTFWSLNGKREGLGSRNFVIHGF